MMNPDVPVTMVSRLLPPQKKKTGRMSLGVRMAQQEPGKCLDEPINSSLQEHERDTNAAQWISPYL